MIFYAPGSGRGECAMVFLTTYVMLFCLVGAEQAKPSGESPPAVTLLTLITGSCQELQRYTESVVGTGVMRSAAEVQTGRAPPFPAPGTAFTLTPFFLFNC